MTGYKVAKKLDYLTFSVSQFKPLDETLFGKNVLDRPRQRNYNRAEKFEIGIFHMWHSERDQMKHSVTLDGATLSSLRVAGISDVEILKWAYSMPKCKFSRVDCCITSERESGQKHGLNSHDIHRLAVNGYLESRLKVDKPVVDKHLKVETTNIGSRKSRNRLFRAYDKGLQLGNEPDYVMRYELQSNKFADHLAKEFREKNTDVGAVIRRYVDFPDIPAWIEICGTESAPNYRTEDDRTISQIEREAHNSRLNWLLTSVAPAWAKIEKYQDENPTTYSNAELREVFFAMVEYYKLKT